MKWDFILCCLQRPSRQKLYSELANQSSESENEAFNELGAENINTEGYAEQRDSAHGSRGPGDSFDHHVILLLDGDGDNMFKFSKTSAGFDGGREVADKLHESVLRYLRSEIGGALQGGISVQCFIFCNVWATQKFLKKRWEASPLAARDQHAGHVSPQKDYFFEEFVRGFSNSTYPFLYVDTGRHPQAADQILIKYLHYFTRTSPHSIVIVGGMQDKGYFPHITCYPERLESRKLRMLRGSGKVCACHKELDSNFVQLNGVFSKIGINNTKKVGSQSLG